MICKTVGSAYVGSNPTPATTQNARSRTYARLCDWDADGTVRCHGLFVCVGSFPLVRGLDAQAAYRSRPWCGQCAAKFQGAHTRTQP
jgi:hypothetical protein